MEISPGDENEQEYKVTVGERELSLTPQNTVIRRFDQGKGAYDHCVVRLAPFDIRALILPAETLELLVCRGCRVLHEDTVDEPTIALFTAELRSQMRTRTDTDS